MSGAANTGQDTIAIGYQTNATAQNSIAIGKTAKVDSSATDAMALGSGAAANVASSVAIGSGSSTTRATDTTSKVGITRTAHGAVGFLRKGMPVQPVVVSGTARPVLFPLVLTVPAVLRQRENLPV